MLHLSSNVASVQAMVDAGEDSKLQALLGNRLEFGEQSSLHQSVLLSLFVIDSQSRWRYTACNVHAYTKLLTSHAMHGMVQARLGCEVVWGLALPP